MSVGFRGCLPQYPDDDLPSSNGQLGSTCEKVAAHGDFSFYSSFRVCKVIVMRFTHDARYSILPICYLLNSHTICFGKSIPAKLRPITSIDICFRDILVDKAQRG